MIHGDDEPLVEPTVEARTDCVLCWFFKRPPTRTTPVMMTVLRMFPQAKGVALCRECLRNLSSMLKRPTKK